MECIDCIYDDTCTLSPYNCHQNAKVSESTEFTGSVQKREKCHECGVFVSKKELAKVPRNGVPWCDDCVSACEYPCY